MFDIGFIQILLGLLVLRTGHLLHIVAKLSNEVDMGRQVA
jgi:hypothetical protein